MRASRNPYHPDVPSQLSPEYQLPCTPRTPTARSTTTDATNKQTNKTVSSQTRPTAIC